MEHYLLNTKTYESEIDWDAFCESGKTLKDVEYHPSWKEMFQKIYELDAFTEIDTKLSDLAKAGASIYPKPEYVFNAFKYVSIEDVRVVIIGQDPYFSKGQAMGLSFSVPVGCELPSSLLTMYGNLKKNGLLWKTPSHGNLEFWAHQGCLLLNTSLTVLDGSQNKNCHSDDWNDITNYMIRYISTVCPHVVFVLWGRPALNKIALVDKKKHSFVISSHPSGLGRNQTLGAYESFNNTNFGDEINKKLIAFGHQPFLWNM